MTDALHRNVAKVIDAGRAIGLDVQPVRFPEGTKTAVDAATAIGCDVGQIVKSLIFAVDGEVVLVYVSGANQLDETKLALAAGGATCSRVDADTVRSATGFPIGGVPRSATTPSCRVFVDPDLLQYDLVWAAAGTWHDVFSLTPQQLVSVSDGTVVEAREGLSIGPMGCSPMSEVTAYGRLGSSQPVWDAHR